MLKIFTLFFIIIIIIIIIIINGLGYTPSQKIELWCVYKISTLHIFTYIKN
jgi:ABC-type nitrate/sulfonate/bicarbonate transport system permease component